MLRKTDSRFQMRFSLVSVYLDDSLTGGERQPHKAGVVDGHDLVSDAELARACRRTAVHHVGQDDSGQDGAPAGLHNHHAEDLAFALLQLQLWMEAGESSLFSIHALDSKQRALKQSPAGTLVQMLKVILSPLFKQKSVTLMSASNSGASA